MGARENVAAVLARLEKKAKPTKIEKPRNVKGKRLYLIICPRCCELNLEQTEHIVTSWKAKGCKPHASILAQRAYRKKNPGFDARRKRIEWRKDPERKRAITRRSYQKHKEKRLANQREYYRLNRDRELARVNAYRARKKVDWDAIADKVPVVVPAQIW